MNDTASKYDSTWLWVRVTV